MNVQTFSCDIDESFLKIVATRFFSSSGNEYVGYVYVDDVSIKGLKPVIVYGEKNLNFWKGVRVPKLDIFDAIKLDFGEILFPVKFETFPNELDFSINGEINGIYYYDESKKICCLKP